MNCKNNYNIAIIAKELKLFLIIIPTPTVLLCASNLLLHPRNDDA